MSDPDLTDLFTPGDGGVPPYLAGRKKEQAYFQSCVKFLKNKKPTHRNLILYGPRGNGKTALLRYLQKETRRQEASKLDILRVTPDELRILDALSGRLMEDHQAVASGSSQWRSPEGSEDSFKPKRKWICPWPL